MPEYIERAVAFDAITDLAGKAPTRSAYEAVWKSARALKKIPAADVVPSLCWIPITEHLPKPETEVMIVCNRNGRRFIATAIHEDGTLFVGDSNWNWNDICEYGRYDEERDDYIIPECWWESRCFTPDDVYNCPVDCEVTHWMPMPDLPEEKNDGDK